MRTNIQRKGLRCKAIESVMDFAAREETPPRAMRFCIVGIFPGGKRALSLGGDLYGEQH